MNTKRLLKLADFLDELPREKFNFARIAFQSGKPMREALKLGKTRCGTTACGIGWLPVVFPRGLQWSSTHNDIDLSVELRNRRGLFNFDAATEWFDLAFQHTLVLFAPGESGFGLPAIGQNASPKTVARRIRRFVEKNARRRA